MNSVLVTGAAGFIGSRVALAAKQAGCRVVGLVRTAAPGEDNIAHDLRNHIESLPPVDWVFHLAGAYAGADQTILEAADLGMARNILDWGLTVGVRNWVFASAAEVYGPIHGMATEDKVARPIIPYGKIKLKIEEMFKEFASQVPDSRIIILRIGEVYGAKSKLLTELDTRLKRGFCPWFGDGEVPLSFVHVDDVARAFVHTLNVAPGFEVWNVADDEPVTWREFLAYFAALIQARPPVHLPSQLGRLYAEGSVLICRAMGRPPVITPHIVSLLTTPKMLSNVRLKRESGFRLLYRSYKTGLQEVLHGVPHPTASG